MQSVYRRRTLGTVAIAVGMLLGVCSAALAAEKAGPAFVPWPKSVTVNAGTTPLMATARVVATDPSLRPLAAVVREEIARTTGLALAEADGDVKDGDIVLSIDPALKGEAYALVIGDRFEVRGGTYNAVALGTVTLLQSFGGDAKAGVAAVPRVVVRDEPAHAYRGLMIDVARKPHSIDDIKQVVLLARAYKIRYLQIHLSDDQAFTFPSTAFPQLATPGQSYTLDELRGLETFARDRGVVIVPELDVPGHSGRANKALPEVFGGRHSTINFGDDTAVAAVRTLIGEMLDVFRSTPYFHIGADEVDLSPVRDLPTFVARKDELKTKDGHDVFRWFINQLNETIREHGRQTIVWEGFSRGGKVRVPTNVIVMPFDCFYYEGPDRLIEDGYPVINASWTPLYVVQNHRWPAKFIYDWDVYQFRRHSRRYEDAVRTNVPPTPQILGAQMCAWEQPADLEIDSLRRRVPAMAERLWNPDATGYPELPGGYPLAPGGYDAYAARAAAMDDAFSVLANGFRVTTTGTPNAGWEGPGAAVGGWFKTKAAVSFAPVVSGTVVRYTVGKGEPVTASSPVADGPVEVAGERVVVRARAFDESGKPVGFPWVGTFEHQPLDATITGVNPGEPTTDVPPLDDVNAVINFKERATVTLKSAVPGAVVRYSLGEEKPVTAKSAEASGPVEIDDSTTLRARCFDAAGKPLGQQWMRTFQRTGPLPNLTLNKPVTVSKNGQDSDPKFAVDGIIDREKRWGCDDAPQWMKIDLGAARTIDSVDVFTFWGDGRHYQYVVDVSTDDATWQTVADLSSNKTPATMKGLSHKFNPAAARYIRLTMLKNSANPGLHVVEVRAYEAEKAGEQ